MTLSPAQTVQRDAHAAPCCDHPWSEHGMDRHFQMRCGAVVRTHWRAVDDIEDEICDCGPYRPDAEDEALWHLSQAARLMDDHYGHLGLSGERQRVLTLAEAVYVACQVKREKVTQ